jgi:hypothetical protein
LTGLRAWWIARPNLASEGYEIVAAKRMLVGSPSLAGEESLLHHFLSGRASDFVHQALRSFILFTLVVVDGKKISGYPLRAISDYIAMLTLSQVRLIDRCGELPSILDLMATACTRKKSQSITAANLALFANSQHRWRADERIGLNGDRGQGVTCHKARH